MQAERPGMIDTEELRRSTAGRVRRRPPPNYGSRRVQLRLLVLVFLTMSVLVLMRKARDPATWWLFDTPPTNGASAPGEQAWDAAAGTDGAALDTRPPLQPQAESGEPLVTGAPPAPAPQNLLAVSVEQTRARTEFAGWTTVSDVIGSQSRELLSSGLWQYRQRGSLDGPTRARWPELLTRLKEAWTNYQARAIREVESDEQTLTAEERQRLDAALSQLQARTTQQLEALEALETLAGPTGAGVLSDDLAAALTELQNILDELAWGSVEDNTVLRAAENEAWLRGWELVAQAARDPSDPSIARVSFVQLFSQPATYRGKLVQVSGTARLGYRTAWRHPRVGESGYYVLWLRPSDGANSPIAVYLLSLPDNFPPLTDRQPGRPGGTELREEVTITGVFFKRWLYASGEGANLAPLVLGRITKWVPEPSEPASTGAGQLDAMAIFYTVVGVGLVALVLAVWAYRSSRWAAGELSSAAQPPAELPPFDDRSVRAPVGESLRRLAEGEDEQ